METGPYPNKKGVEYRRGAVIYYAERGVGSVIYYAERGHLAVLVTVLDHIHSRSCTTVQQNLQHLRRIRRYTVALYFIVFVNV